VSGDWKARAAEVAAADGEEWDRLSAAYDEDWQAAYRAAFREVAASRGWSDEDIESGWLDDLPAQAMEMHGQRDPAEVAAEDVVVCEIEAANA
jgi:hypothetical protein